MTNAIKLSSPATREFWELAVLYEDPHLLALDKPAGLPATPEIAGPQRPSLLMLLHRGIADAKPWATQRGLNYLMNAHRPDVENSGVLLLAKAQPTFAKLGDFFGAENGGLIHVALVRGEPDQDRFEVEAKLAPHPVRAGEAVVDAKAGKRSRTRFEVIERFEGWTLLRCEPFTHRPHQIRAHLRHIRLPVAGDQAYGGKPLWLSRLKPDYHLKPNKTERPLLGQVVLHAESLTLPHPVTGATVTIASPWPKELNVALKYLRKFAVATTRDGL